MSAAEEAGALRRTPLIEMHRALGAKLVEFGGWEMPVSYRGILEEHRAVRTAAGLFDVSHMGEIEVRGSHAADVCQGLTTNDVRRLQDGHVQYTVICHEDGGVVDDVTLYRLSPNRFFFCVNAGNTATVLAWIRAHAGPSEVVDRSDATALLALQGPLAAQILARLTPLDLTRLRSFRFARSEVAGNPALISRTGYTGEDGFELYVDAPRAVAVWSAVLDAGRGDGLEPIGLGARDTLRLEAALPLYGNELDDSTSPLAAGLTRFVKLEGESFIGRGALLHEQAQGAPRQLVGLMMEGPGIARHGYAVRQGEATVGVVTSGTQSPTLGRAVALAYVAQELSAPGTVLEVEIRGRPVAARVVPTPFYRRASAAAAAPATVAGSGNLPAEAAGAGNVAAQVPAASPGDVTAEVPAASSGDRAPHVPAPVPSEGEPGASAAAGDAPRPESAADGGEEGDT